MGRLSFQKVEGEEAEKLDELFGVKDCLIEVNPGRVLMPPDFKEIGERIIDLKVREDDVWLVSYPRTGKLNFKNYYYLIIVLKRKVTTLALLIWSQVILSLQAHYL